MKWGIEMAVWMVASLDDIGEVHVVHVLAVGILYVVEKTSMDYVL